MYFGIHKKGMEYYKMTGKNQGSQEFEVEDEWQPRFTHICKGIYCLPLQTGIGNEMTR